MSRKHWLETADHVSSGDPRIIGQDEHGDLYVPALGTHSLTVDAVWNRRLNLWHPLHWRYYLRSRITGRVAFLESVSA